MNIDTAIRLLEMLLDSTILEPLPHNAKAVKLGIEALKAVIRLRNFFRFQSYAKLPGEIETDD